MLKQLFTSVSVNSARIFTETLRNIATVLDNIVAIKEEANEVLTVIIVTWCKAFNLR